MRGFKTGLMILMAAGVLWMLPGCRDQKQEIPISTVSQSTEDDDPEDTMQEQLPGEGIPVYEVELPDELYDFEYAVWGVSYQLPMTYESFTANGWSYDGDEQEMVSAQSYLAGEIFTAKDCAVTVDIMNPEASELPVSQCYVAGFHVDAGEDSGKGVYVNLPGNIVFQKSVAEEVIQAYDVWKEKKVYGKVSMGVVRTTYVIDEDGIIEKVFEKAKPDTNAAEILSYLKGE